MAELAACLGALVTCSAPSSLAFARGSRGPILAAGGAALDDDASALGALLLLAGVRFPSSPTLRAAAASAGLSSVAGGTGTGEAVSMRAGAAATPSLASDLACVCSSSGFTGAGAFA